MGCGFWVLVVLDGTSNVQVYSDLVTFERGGSPTSDVSCAEVLANDSGFPQMDRIRRRLRNLEDLARPTLSHLDNRNSKLFSLDIIECR